MSERVVFRGLDGITRWFDPGRADAWPHDRRLEPSDVRKTLYQTARAKRWVMVHERGDGYPPGAYELTGVEAHAWLLNHGHGDDLPDDVLASLEV